MTDLESELLNMFADEIVEAMNTQPPEVIAECQREYDDYLSELKQRIAKRAA